MTATNPKARSYFSKLLSKASDATPQHEPVVDHTLEGEEPISRVEAIEPLNDERVAGPLKKNKKRDRGCKRSHSSSRRHRHAEEGSSQSLPESIFAATTKFSKFVHTFVNESSYSMLKATDAASLADSIIELSSRALLIGKMMNTKSANSISFDEFAKMKNELAEAHEKIKSLNLQVIEINALNAQQETEKENLENKITELNDEKLKSDKEKAQHQNESQLLKENLSKLSTAKETDKSTIKLMEKETD